MDTALNTPDPLQTEPTPFERKKTAGVMALGGLLGLLTPSIFSGAIFTQGIFFFFGTVLVFINMPLLIIPNLLFLLAPRIIVKRPKTWIELHQMKYRGFIVWFILGFALTVSLSPLYNDVIGHINW